MLNNTIFSRDSWFGTGDLEETAELDRVCVHVIEGKCQGKSEERSLLSFSLLRNLSGYYNALNMYMCTPWFCQFIDFISDSLSLPTKKEWELKLHKAETKAKEMLAKFEKKCIELEVSEICLLWKQNWAFLPSNTCRIKKRSSCSFFFSRPFWFTKRNSGPAEDKWTW